LENLFVVYPKQAEETTYLFLVVERS